MHVLACLLILILDGNVSFLLSSKTIFSFHLDETKIKSNHSKAVSEVMNIWFQLYCEKERLADDQFDQLKSLVDIGDIVGATGSIKRTEKGKS